MPNEFKHVVPKPIRIAIQKFDGTMESARELQMWSTGTTQVVNVYADDYGRFTYCTLDNQILVDGQWIAKYPGNALVVFSQKEINDLFEPTNHRHLQ